MDINKLREEIEKIDQEIVKLLERRFEVVLEISNYKKENNLAIEDKSREEDLLIKNLSFLNNKEIKKYYISIFKTIIEESKKYQRDN